MFRMYRTGFVVATLLAIYAQGYDAPDYPGPYCAKRRDQCCNDRIDSCSVPISSKYFFN